MKCERRNGKHSQKKVFLCTLGFERRHICVLWWGWSCHLTLLSPAMQGHVGLGSAQPCEARNPPAIPPCCCWCCWLLLLLLSFLSWQSRLFPTPSPPTLLLPSRWHIGSVEDFGGAAGLLGAADQLVSLSACQLVQVEVAVEDQQHTRFLTDDPKS